MNIILAAAAVLALASPAFAFDDDLQSIINTAKPKQLISTDQLITLMGQSAMWCYKETDEGGCAWTDVYLDATTEGMRVEIHQHYDEALDLYLVDQDHFEQERYVCEHDFDWVPSLRVVRQADGVSLSGRALEQYRSQYSVSASLMKPNCFDYQFVRANLELETVTLVQRTYSDFIKDEGSDTLVTLHFDEDDLERLHLTEWAM